MSTFANDFLNASVLTDSAEQKEIMANQQFTSVIARRNAKTQFGHHFVPQTASKLIGECCFAL
jgi:hypothetical protein